MALDAEKITNTATEKLKALGFNVDGSHSKQAEMIQAIVEAVIEGIKADAQVKVTGGSSAGTYQVD
jgi:hypothetical protein